MSGEGVGDGASSAPTPRARDRGNSIVTVAVTPRKSRVRRGGRRHQLRSNNTDVRAGASELADPARARPATGDTDDDVVAGDLRDFPWLRRLDALTDLIYGTPSSATWWRVVRSLFILSGLVQSFAVVVSLTFALVATDYGGDAMMTSLWMAVCASVVPLEAMAAAYSMGLAKRPVSVADAVSLLPVKASRARLRRVNVVAKRLLVVLACVALAQSLGFYSVSATRVMDDECELWGAATPWSRAREACEEKDIGWLNRIGTGVAVVFVPAAVCVLALAGHCMVLLSLLGGWTRDWSRGAVRRLKSATRNVDVAAASGTRAQHARAAAAALDVTLRLRTRFTSEIAATVDALARRMGRFPVVLCFVFLMLSVCGEAWVLVARHVETTVWGVCVAAVALVYVVSVGGLLARINTGVVHLCRGVAAVVPPRMGSAVCGLPQVVRHAAASADDNGVDLALASCGDDGSDGSDGGDVSDGGEGSDIDDGNVSTTEDGSMEYKASDDGSVTLARQCTVDDGPEVDAAAAGAAADLSMRVLLAMGSLEEHLATAVKFVGIRTIADQVVTLAMLQRVVSVVFSLLVLARSLGGS
mmetsp:Transcript_3291/g.11932  ORF Transcript_3291/g.11932 Transcript_3291/m.11932 type:complete len:586 (-) Transcript_3291:136-1893(-)